MQKCDTAYLSKTGWNKLLVPYRFPLTCLFLFLFGLISKKLAHACFQLKCFSFSTLVDLFTAKKNEASAVQTVTRRSRENLSTSFFVRRL